MQGIDWRPDSRLGENPNNVNSANPGFPVLNSDNNAAYVGWNQYGDDALAGSKVVSVGGLNIDGKTNQTPLIPMRSLLFSCADNHCGDEGAGNPQAGLQQFPGSIQQNALAR